jgi:Mg2+ and Co2+ transporter CorA
MAKKNDALNSVSSVQLLQFMKNRAESETKPLVWVDIQGTYDEMNDFAKAFNLHPLTLEECITYDTREKVSFTNNYIYLIIHDISRPGDQGVNMNMIIFPDLLLTFHEKPVHSIYEVVPKLEHCYDTEIPSIEYIVYVILSSIISFYDACVEQVRQKVDLLDSEVLAETRVDKRAMSETLGRLTTTLKLASSLRDNIDIKADLLGSLVRYDSQFSPKGLRYIKSAHDQLLKMDLQISLVHDTVCDINELYMAKISVQLAVVGNQMGMLSKQFAVISAIFLPATLVSGILGMNVMIPSLADPEKDDLTPFAYVMVFMLVISAMQLFLYRKMKWL